ncbi:MAG: HlyC/CorC family transporter [Rubritepida sp.]|nr:HlyC/CorC family transporter [Rubritepida sp.]
MPSDTSTPRMDMMRLIRGLFSRREGTLRDRVEELIEAPDGLSTDAHALGPHERALLGNVLKLRGATANDVMVPRADIIGLPASLTLEQALAAVQREGHSRYPVYQSQLDDVLGMVHIKDIFASVGRQAPFNLSSILRKPLLVVPSVPVLDLLLRMREARIHMALVVDEYGGIDGLITIEDLVETIVGDIADEHDEVDAPQITERGEGVLEVDARTEIETFEHRLGPILTPEERATDIDTVGGLVLTLAGRVPMRGEIFSHSSGLEFRVLDADARRIRRLRVRRPADGAQAAE